MDNVTTSRKSHLPFMATEAGKAIAAASRVHNHDVAVVLGSGWAHAADEFGDPIVELSVEELPGFSVPGVAGHAGQVRSVPVGGSRVLVFLGRTHLYEGHGEKAVAHSVRVAAATGCRTVMLTNAAGSLRPEWSVGQPVLVSDHINFTARSPLVGPAFTDLTDLYSPRLRALARAADPSIKEGIYAAMPGPHYETPAEIRMLRTVGADMVGMSTVLEAIAARAAGLEVLALSLITNPAAGITGEKLDHADVLAAARDSAKNMGTLLRDVITRL
ncbi:MAG: purine-nucleoside phosphorylase [Mycobacteriales bacterium]